MLQKIIIENNNNLPYEYASKLEAFKNGIEYNFKPGVNLIIGPNGSGKSTLFGMLRLFFWCDSTMESDFERGMYISEKSRLFDDNTDKIKDGIKIKHDFSTKVFSLKPSVEFKYDESLITRDNFKTAFMSGRSSMGESTLISLGNLFGLMFRENQTYKFIIEPLKEMIDVTNEIWRNRYRQLYDYYKENQIKSKELEFTVLLDEPDRNLDITNIDEIYGILSYKKENAQIIASVHNPLLIYKLSKHREVNFIELEEGYLEKIKNTIKNIVC